MWLARRLVESLSTDCAPRPVDPMDSLDDPDNSQISGLDGPLQHVTSDGLRRFRAERLLRKDFVRLRSKVLALVRSQLRARGVVLDPTDLEACYAMAWHGLYATVLGGEMVENPSAWLVLVTFRRAVDESRSAARLKGALQAGGEQALDRYGGASEPELAAELDDRARLREVFEGLRASLSERECEAASLCYLQGLSRAEAAARMGISQARMRKLMEGVGRGRPGVAGKVGSLLDTIKAGGWCEQQSSLMRAFAFGVLDPAGERHALAAAHCRECPACRAHVASLRGLASVMPLPLLTPLALTGAGAAGAGAAGAGSGTTSTMSSAGASSGTGATASTKIGAGIWRGVSGSPASGLSGSLAVKLAVAALVLLGGGYAVLGTRAHGNPGVPAGHASAPVPLASEGFASRAPLQAVLPTFGARSPRAHPTGRSSTAHVRSVRTTPPARLATSPSEFSPERVRRERPVSSAVTPVPTPTQSGSSRAAREFGIE
jgi:DNA-directed RNA polymerase specialized sigma24 family protein